LSKLPKEIVDQLSMFGLIEACNGLYGFRDLAAARQVAVRLLTRKKLDWTKHFLNIASALKTLGLA
jgi:hypothetical protein